MLPDVSRYAAILLLDMKEFGAARCRFDIISDFESPEPAAGLVCDLRSGTLVNIASKCS